MTFMIPAVLFSLMAPGVCMRCDTVGFTKSHSLTTSFVDKLFGCHDYRDIMTDQTSLPYNKSTQ